MAFKLLEQAWQVSGVVGEVSIHLHDDLIVSGQGPLKTSDISRTEPKFTGAAEEMHLVPILVLHQSDLSLCVPSGLLSSTNRMLTAGIACNMAATRVSTFSASL